MSDIWSWNNAVDAAGTLLSSSAGSAGELGVNNILDPRPAKVWRAGGMPVEFQIALPATGGVSLFGLFNVNFAQVGAITLRIGTSAGAGDLWEETINEDAGVFTKQAVFVLRDTVGDLAPVAASHASISAEGGTALEIGRVWLGGADWQSAIGHTMENTNWQGEDLSQRSRTPRSGSFHIDRGSRLRTFTANYAALNPDEYMGSLFEMDDRGLAQQMLFVPVPDVYDPHRFAILGYLGEIPATNWQAFMTAGRAITILEAG